MAKALCFEYSKPRCTKYLKMRWSLQPNFFTRITCLQLAPFCGHVSKVKHINKGWGTKYVLENLFLIFDSININFFKAYTQASLIQNLSDQLCQTNSDLYEPITSVLMLLCEELLPNLFRRVWPNANRKVQPSIYMFCALLHIFSRI